MNIAVIFAGGVGKRMKTQGIPKQFLKLNGKPVIIHTLEIFEQTQLIDAIVVVSVKSHLDYMRKLIKEYNISKVYDVVAGGETGQLSIYEGLKKANEIESIDRKIVLIHDGVRPIIDENLIKANIESVMNFGSSISCALQKETTVLINKNGMVDQITDKSTTLLARAPQSFFLDEILEAHEKCIDMGILNSVDSCTMMHNFKKELHIVECKSDNIKITTPDDFYIAKAILEAKNNMEILGLD